MATVGMPGDVLNSVFQTNAYPQGRNYGYVPAAATSFDVRNNYVGELGGLNQDYSNAIRGAQMSSARASAPAQVTNSSGSKPAFWWITFLIVFIIVAWAAKRFAPDGEQFAIIKPNLINWIFITLTVILTSVFLKQVAIRVKRVPFLEPAADLVLSS